MTVALLKEQLTLRGLKKTGRKAELIERILEDDHKGVRSRSRAMSLSCYYFVSTPAEGAQ